MKTRDVQIWSCGGGTQSGAIAVLIGQGKLPKPDLCFMTDTSREKSSTWPFVDNFIRPHIAKVGCELVVVPFASFVSEDYAGLKSANGTMLLPGFTSQSGKIGKLSAFCSGKWKRNVAERYFRSLGIQTAVNWLGISVDELRRVRNQHQNWLSLRYPLVFEIRMTRADCVQLIRSTGWTGPIPHSACWMCPNLADNEWREMKRDWPEDFAKACKVERELREDDPHFWLHPSCEPLETVDFDAQQTMFTDRGCTGGCFT